MFVPFQQDEISRNIKAESERENKKEVIKETEKHNDLKFMFGKPLPTSPASAPYCINDDAHGFLTQPSFINSFPNYFHSLPFSINRNLLQSLFFLFHQNPALLSSYSKILQNHFNYFYTHSNHFPHIYEHLKSCISREANDSLFSKEKAINFCDSRSKIGFEQLLGDYHMEEKKHVDDIDESKKKNKSESFKIDRILNNFSDEKQNLPVQIKFSKKDELPVNKSPQDIPTQTTRSLFFSIGELHESIYDKGFARNTLKENKQIYSECFSNTFSTKDFLSSTNNNQYNKSYKSKIKNKAEQDRKNLPLFYYEDKAPKPFVRLEGVELWRKFHEVCTEMVITKNGRRMFPSPCIQIFNLEKDSLFSILMDVVPVNQFRYKFQGSAWVIAGRADPEPPQDAFTHPDSPALGSHWMNRCISFSRLKLTNHPQSKPGYTILNSMQKYVPRIHILKVEDVPTSNYEKIMINKNKMTSKSTSNHCKCNCVATFVFNEMEFMAVTAYQNEKVTQLKIDHNPFAKGFRSLGETAKILRKRKQNDKRKRQHETKKIILEKDSVKPL